MLFICGKKYIRLLFYRWKKQFKQLLEETGYVTPGKQLSEVRVLFMGRECFEALSHHDCQEIYDQHQKEIIEKAKHNFQVCKKATLDITVFFKVTFHSIKFYMEIR
jgi:glucocorticoid receptor DNA-binding factor 1